MDVLGLRFCAKAFSSCGKRGPLFNPVRGPLSIVASLVAEHRLQTRRLSNCGSRAQLLHGMWDLPRPGLEPTFPALAGRFSTTAPPGKPLHRVLFVAGGLLSCGMKTLSCSMHVGSSFLTRDRPQAPCIGNSQFNHCTTRGVPGIFNSHIFLSFFFLLVSAL